MINESRIQKLIDRLIRLENDESFDQSCFLHHCGTPACIAGHAADMALKESPEWTESIIDQKIQEFGYGDSVDKPYTLQVLNNNSMIDLLAQEWLEISDDASKKLFRGDVTSFGGPENPSSAQATKVLVNLLKTGEVDWKMAS